MTVDELRQALDGVPGDYEVLSEDGGVGHEGAEIRDDRCEVVLE